MIAVIDYEVGNLFSLKASLEKIDADSVLTRDPAVIHAADAIILPGVGAFGQAADKRHLPQLADFGSSFLILQLFHSYNKILNS